MSVCHKQKVVIIPSIANRTFQNDEHAKNIAHIFAYSARMVLVRYANVIAHTRTSKKGVHKFRLVFSFQLHSKAICNWKIHTAAYYYPTFPFECNTAISLAIHTVQVRPMLARPFFVFSSKIGRTNTHICLFNLIGLVRDLLAPFWK